MKRLIFLAMQFFTVSLLFSQNYNFYERNLRTGEVEYQNLEYDTGYNYELHSENGNLKMTGYYYNSDSIKFIDSLIESKIQKIEYFDKNGKLILTSIYDYDKKNVKTITTVIDEPNKMFYSIIFNSKLKKFNMVSRAESRNGNTWYRISEGKMDKNCNPVSAKLEVLSHDGNKTLFSNVDEKWRNGENESSYQVKHDGQQVYLLEKKESQIKISSQQNGSMMRITENRGKDYENKIVSFNESETVNEDFLVCYKHKTFKHLLENGNVNKKREKYLAQDESVFFENGKMTVHQLLLPFDIFGDNDFHQGYVKMSVVDN